ncbi:MAG: protein tyrosine phosphatase family protein [Pseudomonadota bacterium]
MRPFVNSIRTVATFLYAWSIRRMGVPTKSDELSNIPAFRTVGDRYLTSGQPSERQLQQLSALGITTVINLAPQSLFENSVVREAEILAENHIAYTHIPVVFSAPTEEDFDRFVGAMRDIDATTTLIHCAANMRVSAFVCRYRIDVMGEPKDRAHAELLDVWWPPAAWREFLGIADRISQ